MENHTNPETRLRAALVTRYVAQLARMDLADLAVLAADILSDNQPEEVVPSASVPAPSAPVRPTDRPLVGDVWRRKSNGNVVTITHVDVSTFSSQKQLKWPKGSKSRQLFLLSLYPDFVNEFELVKAGEAV